MDMFSLIKREQWLNDSALLDICYKRLGCVFILVISNLILQNGPMEKIEFV